MSERRDARPARKFSTIVSQQAISWVVDRLRDGWAWHLDMIEDAKFYRGAGRQAVTANPIFFYHIPKCGGMVLHHLAASVWQQLERHAVHPPVLVSRIDDVAHIDVHVGKPYAFFSSHLPFGVHGRFVGRPDLITVLRNPISRVRSAYTYHCMRNATAVSEAGFGAFFQEERNRNFMTKYLAGVDEEETSDMVLLDVAKANLAENFAVFCSTRRIDTVCEAYLQSCGLPNVITGRLNQTTERYAIDETAFADEISEANGLDLALFEFARSETTIAFGDTPATDEEQALHPLTVFLVERDDRNASVVNSFTVPTEVLLNVGILDGDGAVDQDEVDKFLYAVKAQGVL